MFQVQKILHPSFHESVGLEIIKYRSLLKFTFVIHNYTGINKSLFLREIHTSVVQMNKLVFNL